MTYTLSDPEPDVPRFPGDTILCGTRYKVLRAGALVATIYVHPLRYDGRASVSLNPIRWAGKMPRGRTYPLNPDPALFFDFVSKHETAEETLPECIRRVDRILKWRADNP